jgi:hypothetical protein
MVQTAMNEIIEQSDFDKSIDALKHEMWKHPQAELKTRHYFADGMYCRVLPRLKDTLIVGKVHKKEHFYIVAQGIVQVAGEDGTKIYVAPAVIVSKVGTKRAVLALEDSVCITVHQVSSHDFDEIEKELLEDDLESPYSFDNKIKTPVLEHNAERIEL